MADPRTTAGRIFDGIASLYDRARPCYPPEAVADLVEACHISGSSQVLEIGCGTGQLTRDLAATGAQLTCLEPGPSLAQIARINLGAFGNVEVVSVSFEEFAAEPSGLDVVVSATAFHWIDPAIAFSKAARLLKPGGHLALVTNTHSHGGSHTDERIANRLRTLHRRLGPEVGDWDFPSAEEIGSRANGGGDIAAVWARVERKLAEPPGVGHLFETPTVRTYPWLATYDTDGYLDLLASQSSYALMDPDRRPELLEGIRALIDDQLGGTVTKEYVTVVAIAPRPAA